MPSPQASDLLGSNTAIRADLLAGNPVDPLLVDELLAKHHSYIHGIETFDARYWATAQDAVCHDHERLARDWRATS